MELSESRGWIKAKVRGIDVFEMPCYVGAYNRNIDVNCNIQLEIKRGVGLGRLDSFEQISR